MCRLILILFVCFSGFAKAQEPQLKRGLSNFVKEYTIYPTYSRNHCIQGTIEVGFKLNKEGKVYYATITRGIGADLDAEALRLIRLTSGKWQMPVSYDTTALIRSPMNFSLVDYGCENVNPGAVGLSIKKYNDEMVSINKIVNFYRNIEQGIENFIEESKIIALKNDLEIDDNFLAQKIAIAEKKIKQGDLQSACEDFKFVKYMGSTKADKQLAKYCK
ncbi:TonB family protein [Pedobacter sp. ASV28]|uniref:TonB family protein n=1 Tax=Pedobacter sp. ASV28 TaxID=2795123 RepID=UPI0018EAB9FE|nr:TonB family protein [Pedobacter sp. ASV28]